MSGILPKLSVTVEYDEKQIDDLELESNLTFSAFLYHYGRVMVVK